LQRTSSLRHLLRRFLAGFAGVFLGATLLATSADSATTLRVAEQPGAIPNFIFPLNDCSTFSITNVQQFQSLQFRPLYFYGAGSSSTLNPQLSLANAPILSRDQKTVTITLKSWRFANHALVTAASALFYLNLYRANPTSVCGYTPHLGLPDQITAAVASGEVLRLTFASPVNVAWLQANYLSQIVPLSLTWSTNGTDPVPACATGTFGAAATSSACQSVLTYLKAQGATSSTFTSPFWQQGVDGPYRLASFRTDGTATFASNANYSGSVKPRIGTITEVPMHSYLQEQTALRAGEIDLGYISPVDLPIHTSTSGNSATLKSYRLSESTPNQSNYLVINRTSTNDHAAILNQLYIRQALQQSLNQSELARAGWKGYALPTTSPLPPSTPVALGTAGANTLNFSVVKARALLTSHGWILSNGTYVCTAPGSGATDCGAGIANQTPLNFNLVEASGEFQLNSLANSLISQWHAIGIAVTKSFDTVSNTLARCHSDNTVQFCLASGGWNYSPQVWPSGEQLFASTSEFNLGHYSDAHMNDLLNALASTRVNLSAYAAYAQVQIPVIYLPVPLLLQETRATLRSLVGVGPSPLGSFAPEYLK
jgi:peptide/nickel transport system substrate-binding protein